MKLFQLCSLFLFLFGSIALAQESAEADDAARQRLVELLESQEGLRDDLLGTHVYDQVIMGMTIGKRTVTIAAGEADGAPVYEVSIKEQKLGASAFDLWTATFTPALFLREAEQVAVSGDEREVKRSISQIGSNYAIDSSFGQSLEPILPGILVEDDFDIVMVRLFRLEPGTSYSIAGAGRVRERVYEVQEPVEVEGAEAYPVACEMTTELGSVTSTYWVRNDHVVVKTELGLGRRGPMNLVTRLSSLAPARPTDPLRDEVDALGKGVGVREVSDPTPAELLEKVEQAYERVSSYACTLTSALPSSPGAVEQPFAFADPMSFRSEIDMKMGHIQIYRVEACDGKKVYKRSQVAMPGQEREPSLEVRDVTGPPKPQDVAHLYAFLAGEFSKQYEVAPDRAVRQSTRAGRKVLELDIEVREDVDAEGFEHTYLTPGTLFIDPTTHRMIGYTGDVGGGVGQLTLIRDEQIDPEIPADRFRLE